MNANGHKSVLIVDDEEEICTLLKHILEIHKPDYAASARLLAGQPAGQANI